MTERPLILLIDDEDQEDSVLALKALGVDARYLYPTEVTVRDLEAATLLAVDEYFDLRGKTRNEDWDIPDWLPPALVPADGLALAAVLRSAAGNITDRPHKLGIALRTSKLDELAQGMPRHVRQPLLAAQYDLEWALSKVDSPGLASNAQLVALASALHTYPQDWRTSPHEVGLAWIGLPKTTWSAAARSHILACRPPANTSSTTKYGLGWLRWLAHRALPYPTFLLPDVYAATHLGVTVDSFRNIASDGASEFADELRLFTYEGPLADLTTRRYWRAGVRDFAIRVTGDVDCDEPALVGEALAATFPGLEPLGVDDPVVTIDEGYAPQDAVVAQVNARRLAPDNWPAYADPAWASAEDVSDPVVSQLLPPRLR